MNWIDRVFWLLTGLALVQIAYYYPQMPAVIASHFDGLGAADGWSSRNGFFGVYLAIMLMVVGIFYWMPIINENRRGPGLKIPNSEYWLAPQRIASTRAFFRNQMRLVGVVHLLLLIAVIQLVILANFNAEPRLHASIGWILGAYFLFVTGWLIYFYRYFKKP